MKKAVVYVRTKNRNDFPDRYVEMAKEYCYHFGYQLITVYNDIPRDGYKLSNCTQALQMIEDAKLHKFDAILCEKEETFSMLEDIREEYIQNVFPKLGIEFIPLKSFYMSTLFNELVKDVGFDKAIYYFQSFGCSVDYFMANKKKYKTRE